jgi:hypothetical protein
MEGVVQFHLLYGLRDGIQNESVGSFARQLCGRGYTGFELVFNSDGGGGHVHSPDREEIVAL